MYEHKVKLENIASEVNNAIAIIDLNNLQQQIQSLEGQTQNSHFWEDNQKAQKISKKLSNIQKEFQEWTDIKEDIKALEELSLTVNMDEDPSLATEFIEMVDLLEKKWQKLEIKTFLSGKYDSENAIISLHAGTGGKDAMDFVAILLRMYLRWAENQGFNTEVIDKSDGEEVGIKSVTVSIQGPYAYGYLKQEKGVHRLVRNSPFNSKNSRETSFALVEVMPDISLDIQAKINKDDLRVDTFRSGGAGGQNVNKVSSAVRITHIPTNIVVTVQNERSQLQNKEQAMKILAAKLIELAEKQQVEELSQIKGQPVQMSWGNQIRSYVLQPYKLVKDHRNNYEENDTDKVFNGEIDGFIESELKNKTLNK